MVNSDPRHQHSLGRVARFLFDMVIVAVLSLAISMSVQGDVYFHVDTNGGIHLSNFRLDERDTLLLQDPATSGPGNPAPAASTREVMPYGPQVDAAARRHDLDSALLHAVIRVESAYNPLATSPKGAAGLMQLMPATARRLGVADIYDPDQNIQGGALYLKDLLRQFDNDLPLTLAAYNAGENAVLRHGRRIPPYRETQNYVAKVMDTYHRVKQSPP